MRSDLSCERAHISDDEDVSDNKPGFSGGGYFDVKGLIPEVEYDKVRNAKCEGYHADRMQ